MTSAYWLV